MINEFESTSTRPYLIRALYEWCIDNGFTPYVAVRVDDTVQVPREHVKDGEIVLNISSDATSSLQLDNDYIQFKARFAGTAREISVPVGRVLAIYARENGQGMAFPVPSEDSAVPASTTQSATATRTPLRDALRGAEGEASKVLQLVAGEGDGDIQGEAAGASDPETPPRPPTGGARPSLKRIK